MAASEVELRRKRAMEQVWERKNPANFRKKAKWTTLARDKDGTIGIHTPGYALPGLLEEDQIVVDYSNNK